MRCVTCGAEMILVSVVPDETMIVSGFERYTMQCLGCGETEQRFLFKGASGGAAQTEAQPAIAEEAAPPPPPASAWLQAVERLREQQAAVTQRRAEAETTEREDLLAPRAPPQQLEPTEMPKPPRPMKPAAPQT